MDETRTYNLPDQEEEGIDIIGLLRQLWDGKKTIIFITHRQAVLDYCTQSLTLKRES